MDQLNFPPCNYNLKMKFQKIERKLLLTYLHVVWAESILINVAISYFTDIITDYFQKFRFISLLI